MASNLTHENGRRSGTKTMFSIVAGVIIARVAVGGIEIGEVIKIAPLDLLGAAALITAFGGIYCARRGTDAWREKKGDSDV